MEQLRLSGDAAGIFEAVGWNEVCVSCKDEKTGINGMYYRDDNK